MYKVLNIVWGIYLLLVGLFMGFAAGMNAFMMPQLPAEQASAVVMGAVMSGGICVVLAATAVGLFMRKSWARIVMIVMAGLSLFSGLFAVLGMLLMPMPGGELDPAAKMVGVFFIAGFLIVIPAVMLVLYSLKQMSVLFDRPSSGAAVPGDPSVPLGIKVLGVYFLVAVLGIIPSLFMPMPQKYPLLGNILIDGAAAKVYFTLWSLVWCVAGVGILKLKKWSWTLAVALNALSAIVTVVNMSTMTQQTLEQMMPSTAGDIPATPLPLMRAFMVIGLVLPAVVLVYLYKKRDLFIK